MNKLYKVYALLNDCNCIVNIESTAFHDEQELIEQAYVKIDEGIDGKIYGHAQPNYLMMKFGNPCFDEKMRCNFKLADNVPVFLTDEEKNDLYPLIVVQPTEQELINSQLMLEIAKLKAGVK